MDVILAIKPKFADLILSGKKKMELRKKIWNKNKKVKKAYLYISAPIMKIAGCITIGDMDRLPIHFLWVFSENLSCLTKEEFDRYYSGYTHGTYIIIAATERFKNPLNPREIIPQFTAPQNFCYVPKELQSKLEQMEVI